MNTDITIPYEIITHIASYINYLPLKILNKNIYREIIKEENGNYWKQLYINKINKTSKFPALNNSLNWKMEYCRINKKEYFNGFDVDGLKDLKVLKLHIKNIKEVPKEIEGLINLRHLNLNVNNIQILPKELGNLTELRVLSFITNKIEEIPIQLNNLKKLQYLDFSANKIKEIPDEIGELNNLEILSFSYNDIKKLSVKLLKQLSNLIYLRCLNLKNNKINKIKDINQIIKAFKKKSKYTLILHDSMAMYMKQWIEEIQNQCYLSARFREIIDESEK